MYIDNKFIQFSEEIGNNLDLIQGAGGNTSLKNDEILWVKASGCWLRDAGRKNIFVPVRYKGVLDRLDKGQEDHVLPERIQLKHISHELRLKWLH